MSWPGAMVFGRLGMPVNGPGRALSRLAGGLALAAAVLLALVVLVSPVAAERRGGTYRAALGADPPTLDPALATDTTSSAIIRQVFDGLVELDQAGHPVPALAERWTVSPDGRVYRFTLRQGVRFHHGREMTADDVRFSLDRAARGKKPWAVEKLLGAAEVIGGQAETIRGVRVPDPRTVELTLERPFPPFLLLLAYDAAFIVPKDEAVRRGPDFASHPVGTGAFRFVSWRRDDQVVLEAFPDHFRGAPYLERVIYRILPDDNTRFQEYRAGGLEHVDVPAGQLRAVRADPALARELAVWPILGTYALRFTLTQAPFHDNRALRQALNHAIDKDAIARVILEGSVVPARGVLPPGMPGHDSTLQGYPYDPARARRLLAEAGYSEGRGLPPITLHYNTSAQHRLIAEFVQAQLKAIGVPVRLANLDWAAYIKLVDDGGTQWHRMGWIADYPDPENFLTVLFHTRNAGARGNTSRFSHPEVDRLLDEADRLPAGPERLLRFRQAERLIVEEAPWVLVYWYTSRLLVRPWVRGLERSPMSVAPELHMAPLRKVWFER